MARLSTDTTFARRIDSIGWAIFFVWVGTALLAGVGWTWSLIGTGIIILSVQTALFFNGERIDAFMSAVGIVLLGGSIADLFGSPWSFVPALLIVIGLAMLFDSVRGARWKAPPRA